MASLIKLGDRYYAQFYEASRRPQRKRVALKTTTKRAAERLRRDLEDQYALGSFDPWNLSPPPSPATTLHEAAEAFLAGKRHRRARTQHNYRTYLGRLGASLPANFSVAHVTAQHITAWLDSCNIGDVTRKTYVRHLRVFMRWCLAAGCIDHDCTDDVPLRRVPSKYPKWLRPEEVQAVLDAIDREARTTHWLKDLILVAVNTGLRRGELLALRWSAVDLRARTLTVENGESFQAKSGKDRIIPLSDEATAVLGRMSARRRLPSDLVFRSAKGAIDELYLSHLFKKYAVKAGVRHASLHGLRHTACSWLAMNGASVEAIRLFAGHSSITVTQKYMHLSEDAFASQIRQAMGRIAGSGMPDPAEALTADDPAQTNPPKSS